MKSCASCLPFLLLGIITAIPAQAQLNTYEEMKAELRAKGLSHKTLSADFTMEMSMQGMAMTVTGDMLGKGSAMIMNMSMEIPGMPEVMTMKMTTDLDGIMWIESSAGGMNQVMKMDMEKMKGLIEESGMDVPFDSSMGDFLGQLTDPVEYLEQSEQFLEFNLEGIDEVNEDSVYVLNATVKAEGFQQLDPTGMLGQMGAGSFDSYKMYLGVDDGIIRKMDMGVEGMHITQTYSNIKLNEDLSDKIFTYSPPAGMQVMDMTEMMKAQIESMGSGIGENGKFHAGDVDLPDVLGTDLNGNEVKLSDYRGKVVLIDFWATWCPPCIEDLPDVLDTYAEFKDAGLVILGVSLDNDISELTAFQAEHPDMSWVQICEEKGWESSIVHTYGVQAIPHTLLLDQNGTVAGADLKGKYLRDKINELLNW